MNLSSDIVLQLSTIDDLAIDDPFLLLDAIGEDPSTFFDHGRWEGLDFSDYDMRMVHFDGAILTGCIFRQGDISDETRKACLVFSGNRFVEVKSKQVYVSYPREGGASSDQPMSPSEVAERISVYHRQIQTARSFEEALQVIAAMDERGIQARVGTFTEAVHRADGLDDIIKLMSESTRRNIELSESFFAYALKKCASVDDMHRILSEMDARSLRPTAKTFEKALETARFDPEVARIVSVMRERFIVPQSQAFNAFVRRTKLFQDLRELFGKLRVLGISINNEMLEWALRQSHSVEDMAEIVEQLAARNAPLDRPYLRYRYKEAQIETLFELLDRARYEGNDAVIRLLEETLRYNDRPSLAQHEGVVALRL
ncbi:hypothetical protein C8J36_11411 [Rhizobium sp. PP-F2F-G48]|uniref:hypothetical protein n=1 Tax=Rhizobium sp. PP-F2F-G48 TaxID=2135651 RepID=UPI001043E15C|nr:hypothetical protein [Rhizobium sp. PP-F2F-G48]TCM48314.1 hypothetical protein C8J36_11411 [Rhizobium sp. PP-F2F-G48]